MVEGFPYNFQVMGECDSVVLQAKQLLFFLLFCFVFVFVSSVSLLGECTSHHTHCMLIVVNGSCVLASCG